MRQFRGPPIRDPRALRRTLGSLGNYGQSDPNAWPQSPDYNEEELFAPPKGADSFDVQNPAATISISGVNLNAYPFSVGQEATLLVAANPRRRCLIVQSFSGSDLWINFGQNATPGLGLLFAAVGAGILFDTIVPTNAVYAYFDNAAPQTGILFEGV